MSGAEILPIAMTGLSVGSSIVGAAKSADAARESGAATQAQIQAQYEANQARLGTLEPQREQLRISREAQQMAAREQADAFEFEGRGLDRQATRYRSAAAVDEAARRTDLQNSLETIQVMRAGRGLSLDSPTGKAITSGVTERASRDIMTSKSNFLLDAAQSDVSAELSRRKARYAELAGESAAKGVDAQIKGIDAEAKAIEAQGRAILAGGKAAAAATDAQVNNSIIGGIGRVAGAGLDFWKLRQGGLGYGPGYGGYGSGGGASP